MMNKKILILAVWGLLLASCSDWLKITPADSVVEDNLFEESTGFQNALNGVYEQLSSEQLYGRELTFGLIDAMGQVYCIEGENWYNIKKYHYYYQAARLEYDGNGAIKGAFNALWTTAYNTIANCNNIINHIDKLAGDDFRLGEAERLLIKGEAMAVRAMLHFDLLRIFAPAPGANNSSLYIPYVTEFPYYGGQAPLNVEETMKKIETDLLEAREMIMGYDTLNLANRALLANDYRFSAPSVGPSGNDGSTTVMLPFYQFRGYRMNGIAINALLARFYSYWGGEKHALAAGYAQKVVDFVVYPAEGVLALEYTGGSYIRYDRKFSRDLIFCLSYPTLQQDYKVYAVSTSNSCLTISKYNTIWKYDLADNGDYRLGLIKDDYGDYMPLKNIRLEGSNDMITKTEDMAPMIRLSEMHLVLAEYYASVNNFGLAAEYINKVRIGRNCKGDVDLGITDMTTFKFRLLGEVRREFFSEGQTFFYYKKYGEKFTATMNPDSFVVPKPESENIN